eukprot:COSAG06_NODE_194_length_20530_cov_9.861583_1_plen_30_part_10
MHAIADEPPPSRAWLLASSVRALAFGHRSS